MPRSFCSAFGGGPVNNDPAIAVIGFGSIGRHHARILADMPLVDFVGIVDPLPSAQSDARRLGYGVFDSVSRLRGSRLDAAVVAVPTAQHYEVALSMMDAGIALLLEKPIASTIEQGTDIIERSRKNGLPLMVGYVERFNPAVIAAQRLMNDGLVGTPLHLATRRVGVMPPRATDANVIVDIGVHDIDIISFLLQTKLQIVSAQGGMAIASDRIDYASLALDAGGIVAHATMNWITPVKVRDLIVTGSSGYLQVDYLRQRTYFAPGRNFVRAESYEALIAQYEEGTLLDIPIDRHEPLRLQLERFVGVLRGTAAAPDPEIALVSLRIALEATEMITSSMRLGVPG